MHGARALALLRGRAYVLPQDVRDLAKMSSAIGSCSRTRPWPTVTADQILDAVIEAVKVPEIDLARDNAA